MQSNSSDDPLQDLALVKEILQRQEDRVILPPWAWYFWALVVALGTAASVVAVGEWGWTHPQVALAAAAFVAGGVHTAIASRRYG